MSSSLKPSHYAQDAIVRTPDNPPGYRDIHFTLPTVRNSEKERARRVYALLEERHPDARCELDFTSPHELLIATILSAQATDVGVNKATPGLFRAFPTPEAYAQSTVEQIEKYIKTIGLFRNKAKHIHGSMTSIVRDHGSEVPRTVEELLELPGVARKTAGVVLSDGFSIHMGVVVDTHVQRLAVRFGLADESLTVPMIERRLMALYPRHKWKQISHLLIFHGRRVSKARGYADEELDLPLARLDSYAKERRQHIAHTRRHTAGAR